LIYLEDVTHIEQISNPYSGRFVKATRSDGKSRSVVRVTETLLIGARSEVKGVKDMLGIIAVVLIVLWLLGLLAFHVSSGVIHVLLVIGIVMLLAHFFRGRTATP
jgi:hypothetical protein